MTRKILWLVVIAIVLSLTVGTFLWLRPPGNSADVDSAQRIAAGKAVYGAHCAACHGADLAGQPNWRERLPNGRLPAPPHDVTGHTWHHDDDMLFALTKHGPAGFAPPGYQSDMPAYAGILSDAEIRAVLAYIKSTWPPDIQARQAAITEQSKRNR